MVVWPKKKPCDCKSQGFFVPENMVPKVKVRVELTQGNPYRFLSLVRFVQRFHHETYSLIGSLSVLAAMVCLIKGVGQAGQGRGEIT